MSLSFTSPIRGYLMRVFRCFFLSRVRFGQRLIRVWKNKITCRSSTTMDKVPLVTPEIKKMNLLTTYIFSDCLHDWPMTSLSDYLITKDFYYPFPVWVFDSERKLMHSQIYQRLLKSGIVRQVRLFPEVRV